jgi:hypothetical protein
MTEIAAETETTQYGTLALTVQGWAATPMSPHYVRHYFESKDRAAQYLKLCDQFTKLHNQRKGKRDAS